MDKKVTGIVSYITLIGWLVAFFAGDKEGAKFHLNQSLVLMIASYVWGFVTGFVGALVPLVGTIMGLVSIVFTVFWIMGLIYAIKEEEKALPVIGSIKILK